MKKFISLLLTVTLFSTIFVANVSALTQTNAAIKTDVTTVDANEYNTAMGTELTDDDYDFIRVNVSLSGMGGVSTTWGDEGINGYQINNFTYELIFDSLENVYTTKKAYYKNGSKLSLTAAKHKWVDGDKAYKLAFDSQFPGETDDDISYSESQLTDMYVLYVAVIKDKKVTVTVGANTLVCIQNFEESVPVGNVTKYDNINNSVTYDVSSFTINGETKEFDTANTTINSTGAVEGKYNGKILKHIATVLDKSALTKKISIKNESTGETRVSGRTIAQTLGGIGVDGATVTGTIAIGVLTDTDAVFTFSLVD